MLMWPMYTSLNMFMGCFLMNGIVQYVLVVRPSLIPDSWNDKFVAWGATLIVLIFFILASGTMHYNGILPPSYFALRGIGHDLSEQPAIVLRRTVLFVSLPIICSLRILISINPQRSFYSLICKKFGCYRNFNCSRNAENEVPFDENDDRSHYSIPDKSQPEPSNQVISNGTLFIWSTSWFVGMALRWIYGDDNLYIADFCSIAIFYVYPLAMFATNSNIKQFLKRRMVFLYHRCVQDIFFSILMVKYFCTLGCCRQRKDVQEEQIIADDEIVSGQWAVKASKQGRKSLEAKDRFYIENESIHTISGSIENCVLESVE